MKAIEYSLGDIVEFIWDDILVDAGWTKQSKIKENPKDTECKIVGYFIKSNIRFTILAGISGTRSSDVNSIMWVPTGCIKEHRKLS